MMMIVGYTYLQGIFVWRGQIDIPKGHYSELVFIPKVSFPNGHFSDT